jgi:hypothetical protein
MAQPTELYISGEDNGLLDFRVMYHIAGKILSGPAPWVEHTKLGEMHNYHAVQSQPTFVGLRVSTTRDSFEYAPQQSSDTGSDTLCLDFRLQVREQPA